MWSEEELKEQKELMDKYYGAQQGNSDYDLILTHKKERKKNTHLTPKKKKRK